MLSWPPNSPDLNPMEHLQYVLDQQVHSAELPPRLAINILASDSIITFMPCGMCGWYSV